MGDILAELQTFTLIKIVYAAVIVVVVVIVKSLPQNLYIF